jgi:hypothetical protein
MKHATYKEVRKTKASAAARGMRGLRVRRQKLLNAQRSHPGTMLMDLFD